MTSVSTVASQQWATRPMDERFLTLEDMLPVAAIAKQYGREVAGEPRTLKLGVDDDSVYVNGEMGGRFDLTYHAFGQTCARVGAPAGYLRSLPPVLAAANLTFGLQHREEALEPAKFYLVPAIRDRQPVLTGPGEVYAVTGPKYGRVWNYDVVKALIEVNERSGGVWKVPAASYSATDPRRATTLYLGKSHLFTFLVDEGRVIDVEGRKINRGFIVSNSEIGEATLSVSTFTYDFVCDNRCIWGQKNVNQIKIRHTSGAPDRFLREVQPALRAYAESSAATMEAQIKRAAQTPLSLNGKRVASDTASQVAWLRDQGFSSVFSQVAVQRANAEMGGMETVWEAVNGITAAARDLKPHTDERVAVEQQAGDLLEKLVPTATVPQRATFAMAG